LSPEKKLAKEKLAKEIKARADQGEDFVKLAKLYSDDPGVKSNEGELTLPRGRAEPEFETAAFALKPNQISDIVETKYGYHIIKMLEKIPAHHQQFAEVEEKIKDHLVSTQAGKRRPAYLAKIKAEYNVALMDPSTGKPMAP
jgi:parvulin-like peptidyl-prolyl isomerase